ncbi:PREDICTED: scavenger receptor cysteine-rich domain-containing group B protein [Dipodomys ordii]|uniref:Scavenger receptor cysteine-rich domain-containing group B protein n=1 Tax=Dipodomys ordii TaxID=10020 RepID=A0A1S3GEB8_DIPOR|nr:PREDICTED: scavenger receptor cysteine-rich domain-containing group B protein [Dipodomys ordii]
MGPLERPSTSWVQQEAEMSFGPQLDERSGGWRPGNESAAPPPLPPLPLSPALSFLFFLPLASALQTSLLSFPELRLVGGPSRCRGRLEVLHGGSWGSVCDDDWDVVDANVVCRQLGCGLALPVPRPLAFGQGWGPILLDNVECRGQEAALSECGSRGWGIHNCFHYEDVAVLCDEFLSTQPPMRKALTSSTPTTAPQNGKGEGSVRLVGGAGPCQGRVEILHGGLWGTVCDDDWGLPDAAVVCRQLGCGAALAATTNAFFGYGTGHILLDNVHCEGGEPRLAACLSLGWGVHNCGHHEDLQTTRVGAQPSGETVLLTTAAWASGKKSGRLRLVGGPGPCRGRVEVLYAGAWGTVCDDDWDFSDARVACREAGCGPALGATGLGHFGYGRGPVLLDNVGCTGTEARLSDCFHLGWGQHNCGHHEDAGALCAGPEDLGLQAPQDGSETTRVPTPRPRDGGNLRRNELQLPGAHTPENSERSVWGGDMKKTPPNRAYWGAEAEARAGRAGRALGGPGRGADVTRSGRDRRGLSARGTHSRRSRLAPGPAVAAPATSSAPPPPQQLAS